MTQPTESTPEQISTASPDAAPSGDLTGPAPFTLRSATCLRDTHDEKTHLLVIPRDALRLWNGTGDAYPRPRGESAPAGHRPVGWLLADGTVILEEQVSSHRLNQLRDLFTGPAAAVNDTADLPPEMAQHITFNSCARCGNAAGKMHAARCPHAGKRVGDHVR